MRREWVREAAGWLGAVAVALVVTAQVTASARSELLFRDGDSLIVALLSRALREGGPQDWAMSSVLFLPETAVFLALDAVLPFHVDGVLAASAAVNLVALYGAFRLAAGRRRPGRSPVAWSLIGLGVFGLIAMTETSASRDALELASLLLTTTYYSATVVAVVLTIGLLRRALDSDGRALGLIAALGAVAAVSTLSNPLFAVWATVPLTIAAGLMSLHTASRRRMLWLAAALIGGTVIGFIARIPFSAWIANTGAGYAQPAQWAQSLGYYGDLAGARLSSPLGVLGSAIAIGLLIFAIWRSTRQDAPGARIVALSAWLVPVIVVVGAVALGTHAARYLQPVAFAPVLALVAMPVSVRVPRRVARSVIAVVAVVLTATAGVSIPRMQAAATRPDADLTCVTDWVNAADRTGAGQFWTVRLPKLHLDDPSRLVQVDHQLRSYAWLVNRADFAVGEVTFLIEDAQTVQWQLPVSAVPEDIVSCGRYRIVDFGDTALPLGPQRS